MTERQFYLVSSGIRSCTLSVTGPMLYPLGYLPSPVMSFIVYCFVFIQHACHSPTLPSSTQYFIFPTSPPHGYPQANHLSASPISDSSKGLCRLYIEFSLLLLWRHTVQCHQIKILMSTWPDCTIASVLSSHSAIGMSASAGYVKKQCIWSVHVPAPTPQAFLSVLMCKWSELES